MGEPEHRIRPLAPLLALVTGSVLLARDGAGGPLEGSTAGGTAQLVQVDGYLSMTAAGGLLEGGINRDGTFEVGGWTTQQGGALQQAYLASGVQTGDALTGSMEARQWGSVEGIEVDCTSTANLTATRQR